ncbi:MAG: M20/M25/M40 family metallo-hydrolase, partial [Coriobacteriales bacterium]|nr:M20/M25/M40 family metallo-hydrolase [Coriobacteriales bacterium]
MKKADLQFLKEICEAPSPSGYEWPAAEVFRNRLARVADTIETTVLGSVHAVLKGKAQGPSVMIAGHIDEIGMMVKYIDENGYVSFDAIGGIDAAILPGLRIDLYATGKGTGGASNPTLLRGIIGRKPIHLIEADERKNVTAIDKLFIDFGLSGDKAKEMIRIGDSMTFGVGFEEFGDGFAVTRAFDDKMGAWIAARVLEEVKKAGGAPGDVIAAATVQEEIGARGAMTSVYAIDPDIGLATDVGHATDYPGIEKSRYGAGTCGGGPMIARGANINPVLFERLVAAAEAAKIPFQIDYEPRATGTDANVMQISRSGKVTGLISVPLRYMHTPTEVMKLDDLDNAV